MHLSCPHCLIPPSPKHALHNFVQPRHMLASPCPKDTRDFYTAVPLPTNPCISLPQHLPQVHPGLRSYTPRSSRVGATCHLSLKPEHLTHPKDSSEVMLVGVGLRCFTLPMVVSLADTGLALGSQTVCPLPCSASRSGVEVMGIIHEECAILCLSHTTVSSLVVRPTFNVVFFFSLLVIPVATPASSRE